MKVVAVVLSLAYFAALIALAITWSAFTDYLEAPGGAEGDVEVVVVPEGATAHDVPRILKEAGLLEDPEPFQRYVDDFRTPMKLAPGEYAVTRAMTPVQKLGRLASGQLVTYTVAIRPGAPAEEVIEVLAEQGLGEPEALRALVRDASYARSLGVEGPGLEGFLYPDAYDLPRGLEPKVLLAKLVERYRSTSASAVAAAAAQHELTPYEVVTLASLVEAADIPSQERRFYARLLLNRLRRRIPLKSRASYAYGKKRVPPEETEASVVRAKRRRRERVHPWDTARVPGLPATPIGNPALPAVRAIGNPANSDALYMVRRDNGTHVFCADLECYDAARRQVSGRPARPPPPPAPPPVTEEL